MESNVGLFKRKAPQAAFEGSGFTITKILYRAPPLSIIPSVYQDEKTRRWAVRFPGQEPAIFSYDDLMGAEIVERQPDEDLANVSNRRLAFEILKNPNAVSSAHAAKRGVCLGISVVVWVRVAGGEVAHLELPIATESQKRSSLGYKRSQGFAKELKLQLDSMGR